MSTANALECIYAGMCSGADYTNWHGVAAVCRFDTRLLGMTRSSGGGCRYMAPPHVSSRLLHPSTSVALLIALDSFIDY